MTYQYESVIEEWPGKRPWRARVYRVDPHYGRVFVGRTGGCATEGAARRAGEALAAKYESELPAKTAAFSARKGIEVAL